MPPPPEVMTTRRLILRRPVPEDAGEIGRSYAHDPEVTRYLLFRPDQTDGELAAFLAETVRNWEKESAFSWVLVLRESGRLIGMVDARVDSYMVNVGYVLAKEHWGQGYATEALRAVVAWTDAQPGIHRV